MQKIKLYGLPRSGGTLIFNIVKELFPKDEIKPQTHTFFEDGKFVIITYRDFRDSAFSSWRVLRKKFDSKKKVSFEEIYFFIANVKKNIRDNLSSFKIKKYDRKLLFLRYEDWFDDRDYLFDQLEKFFDIKIDLNIRKKINEKFSIENIKKIQSRYASFKYYDKDTHIHGNHIYNGKPEACKSFMRQNDFKLITYVLQEELCEWKYIEEADKLKTLNNKMYLRYLLNYYFYCLVQSNLNFYLKKIKKITR